MSFRDEMLKSQSLSLAWNPNAESETLDRLRGQVFSKITINEAMIPDGVVDNRTSALDGDTFIGEPSYGKRQEIYKTFEEAVRKLGPAPDKSRPFVILTTPQGKTDFLRHFHSDQKIDQLFSGTKVEWCIVDDNFLDGEEKWPRTVDLSSIPNLQPKYDPDWVEFY